MPRIGIVTDSTCDLGPETLAELGVVMVPLKVLFDDESYLDWVDLVPEEFFRKLASSQTLPKTSQPSPAEFVSAYKALADEGFEAIVSVHLTGALSGTMSSALMAAQDCPIPVHCVDTKNVSQALGLVVRATVEARDEGLDAVAIAARAQEVADSTKLFFMLDTLEYLVKGGRAGKAQGLAASVLGIKPVLTMNDEGIIEPFKKVKGRKRGISEMALKIAEDAAAMGPLRGAILHGCLEDTGQELVDEIAATGATVEIVSRGRVGAVIGTYAGPGAIGIAYHPA
jgi:DegV family protein with EDD domain